MFSTNKLSALQLPAPGYSWPGSGSSTQDTVEATMGPRQYAGHANNYDFLQGTDIPAVLRQVGYTMMSGPVTRTWWGFFPWQSTRQLAEWSIASGALATFAYQAPTSLLITGTRGGATSFPATSTNFVRSNLRVDVSSADWYRQVSFTANPSLTGGVYGFGIWDQVSGEYVTCEYDGTTLTCRGKEASGLMPADGFTASASPVWIQIYYTQSTNTVAWMYSNDQTNWTTFKTQNALSFTRNGFPAFSIVQYWKSLDTNAAVQTIQVDNDNTADNQTVPRFGNFVQTVHPSEKFIVCHLDEPLVLPGDFLESGQAFGIAGQTGYDPFSGGIDHIHFHCERALDNTYPYTRANAINMVVPGIMPGVSLTGNVSVVRSTANDPLGQSSVLYTVTVNRANQDFYQNTFVMVGTLGTATINYNTRAGLNANVDLPNGPGNYQSPAVFNRTSTDWVCAIYFNTATYGTFLSGNVQDPSGNILTVVS